MTPTELVDGAKVKKVSASATKGSNGLFRTSYRIEVEFANGMTHYGFTSWKGLEVRLARKVGIELRTKAAKKAVVKLGLEILAAVTSYEATVDGGQALAKAEERSRNAAARKAERKAAVKRIWDLEKLSSLIEETGISLDDLVKAWHDVNVTRVLES